MPTSIVCRGCGAPLDEENRQGEDYHCYTCGALTPQVETAISAIPLPSTANPRLLTQPDPPATDLPEATKRQWLTVASGLKILLAATLLQFVGICIQGALEVASVNQNLGKQGGSESVPATKQFQPSDLVPVITATLNVLSLGLSLLGLWRCCAAPREGGKLCASLAFGLSLFASVTQVALVAFSWYLLSLGQTLKAGPELDDFLLLIVLWLVPGFLAMVCFVFFLLRVGSYFRTRSIATALLTLFALMLGTFLLAVGGGLVLGFMLAQRKGSQPNPATDLLIPIAVLIVSGCIAVGLQYLHMLFSARMTILMNVLGPASDSPASS